MTSTRKGALLLIATALMLAGSAPQVAASDQPATASIIGPRCPRGATLMQWTNRPWRGWYGCVKRRREVRPRGCRAGYVLKIKRRRGERAYRCKRVALPRKPEPTIQQPNNPNPPQAKPQPSSPGGGITYQTLIDTAYNAALSKALADIHSNPSTQYRGFVEEWWMNAGLDSNRNVVSPVIKPWTRDAQGRWWDDGCKIAGEGAASCTVIERKFYGGDSSVIMERNVVRNLVTAYIGTDGRIYLNSRNPDWPDDKWYRVCYGDSRYDPSLSGLPYCQ